MRFKCETTFDITATGVTGHFKSNRVPFYDKTNTEIEDIASWNRARNRQRNWETLTQIISLRAQLDTISEPERVDGLWEFTFSTSSPGVFGQRAEVLLNDCQGVPMIVDLSSGAITDIINISGENQNIWFYILED